MDLFFGSFTALFQAPANENESHAVTGFDFRLSFFMSEKDSRAVTGNSRWLKGEPSLVVQTHSQTAQKFAMSFIITI